VLSFAEASGNLALAVQARVSRHGVTAGSGNAIMARCQNLDEVAANNLTSLAPYGVTQAKLNTAKQRLKSYDALRGSPRQAKTASAAATRPLEALFPEVERLLTDRVDRLLWQFRESNPEFYERYQVARTVVPPATQTVETVSAAVTVPQPQSIAA
jgi:hypothetical protein